MPRRAATALLALALSLAPGCVVRVYQPLAGLQRPTVTDPKVQNFRQTRLDVHCVPGGILSVGQASALCQKVRVLFENQGAYVRTYVSSGRTDEDGVDAAPAEASGPMTELSLELRARSVHASNHPLSWLFCFASFTVLPGTSEVTFAHDLTIRDGTGFLLVTDSLEARLVTRFGFGPWLGNATFDLWRDEADDVLGEGFAVDLSTDLYAQLTQRVFDAKLHAEVLQRIAGPAD